jgi:GT2 family glycosyltransferase
MERIKVRAKFFFEGGKKFFLKGITYGPFAPDNQGDHFGKPERVSEDLRLMREAGINLVRVYYTPPKWFADLCLEAGMRMLITIPWAEHVAFLQDRKVRREVIQAVRDGVKKHVGHPAVFGYLVGNEIPSSMVRWLGVRRVTEFIEELIEIGREQDEKCLFSYASFPPTEYLLPQNVDFFTFNVYLHRREDFERYLARLQNLAEDRPLIIGEFGMDTIRHSEEEQAEMLRWHIESVVRGGLAGTVIYSWTDEWFRGGMEITDWAFGLTTRERKPKKSYYVVKELFAGDAPMTEKVRLPSYPKVSVIVCSYNGAKTLDDCLTSLREINYPNYEVVLVDDGSKDNTQEIVARHPWVVNVRQENKGLSVARNVGAATGTGEIIAYTDSDCMADPDWLYFLVGTLLSGDYAGVGGPNISPPAQNWVQACVAAAPGGPSHVLLTDVVAEHIPGCNMAFHRWAFERVNGFDPEYRKAGDDVDFCWRLQQSGCVIAFSPAAIVWHYRRFTLDAFRKQQEGYGEAESLLRFKHLAFFGPTGTAKWKGQIYGAPRFTWLINRPVIYHGIFGEGLFQCIYPTPQSEIAAYLSSIEWVALTAFVLLVSLGVPELRILPYVMFGGTFLVALSYMIHAKLEPRFDTIRARLLVAFLALMQPLVRGWWRYYTWLKFKRTPASVIVHSAADEPTSTSLFTPRELCFWNEAGQGREVLLQEIVNTLENEGWSYSIDTGWQTWDIQIYGSLWWGVRLKTVTEYHGGPKCLTRVGFQTSMVATTFLINLILLGFLVYRGLSDGGLSLFLLVPYFGFLVFLGYRALRLRRRVSALVQAAAARRGLSLIGKKATTKGKAGKEKQANVSDSAATAVSPGAEQGASGVSPGAGK